MRSKLVRLCGLVLISQLLLITALAAEEKIKIGVSTALTGEAAAYGTDIRNSLLFANEKFGNGKYEFIFEDDRCDPKFAATAAQKLANIDKVKYVIGFACSGAASAAAPILEKSKVLTMITCASATKIENLGDYIFRSMPLDRKLAETIVGYWVMQKSIKNLAIISEETEYCQGLESNIRQLFTENQPDFKYFSDNYAPGNKDFRSLLLRLRAKSPDSLFVNTQSEEALGLIVKQLAEMKWSPQIYGAYWTSSNRFLELVGPLAEGVRGADVPFIADTLVGDGPKLYAEFLAKYGNPRAIETLFITNLNGFRALIAAIESGQDPKAFLYQTKFDGVSGPYSFDRNGEFVGFSFVMKEVKNNKIVPLR